MRPLGPAFASLRHLTNPSVRSRKAFTSSFFWATFLGAIVTVSLSASTILPCPAKKRKEQYRNEIGAYHQDSLEEIQQERLLEGERIRLTKKGGWIEIDENRDAS